MNCRFCGQEVTFSFIDMVNAPPSNSFLTKKQLNEPETYYPLKIFVCEQCWLVQINEYARHDDIFSKDYAYFSSFSSSWLKHCKNYVQMITKRLALTGESHVAEIASNDGYLLQYFVEMGIPNLGIEPTAGTVNAARKKGVETIKVFWGENTARELVSKRGTFDLMLGNNVMAHVPNINDFIKGFTIALKPKGTVTFEFPHLLNLIRYCQFDTIYHEHFSYLSLGTVDKIMRAHGLQIYDVEELPTHGGSLRLYVCHKNTFPISDNIQLLEQAEEQACLKKRQGYENLQSLANGIRRDTLAFLYEQKQKGLCIAAYGAAAKGNTLLNYCGIKGTELIDFVVDASPHKQGLFLPGSHIPIVPEEQLKETKPDIIFILPWNLKKEIMEQLSYIRSWNGKFVSAIPKLSVS